MGDEQRSLVAQHLDLVHRIAGRVYREVGGGHVEFDDLVAFGSQGLLEAASRYDASRGTAFAGFAYYRIRGAIYDGLRRMGTLPASLYRQVMAQRRADQYLENRGSRARHDLPETGADSGDTQRRARALARTLRAVAFIHVISSACGELEEMVGPDARALRADDALARHELGVRLREAIARLPERERHLIQRSYFEGATLGEAGRELGLSPSWSSRLHARAVDRLRDLLADEAI